MLRPTPAVTGSVADGLGRTTPGTLGKPADGAERVGLGSCAGLLLLLLLLLLWSGLGTVSVVNLVVVALVVEVQSYSGPSVPAVVGRAGGSEGAAPLDEIGHTVVPIGTTSVVTWPILSGQSVLVGAQLVMVYVVVV